MKTCTPEELKKVLADHAKWLGGDSDGVRANLSGAYLRSANLSGADLSTEEMARRLIVPTGAFEAYKQVTCGTVLKLEIPADAKRVGGLVGRKCRASKAKVIEAIKHSGEEIFISSHDRNFKYQVGATVSVDDFNEDPRIECAAGIHFFMTEIEAREY